MGGHATAGFRTGPAIVATIDTVYQQASRLVRSSTIELLTSDVFDTLVCRPVAEPSDLFVQLADVLITARSIPDHVDAQIFTLGRVTAERRARETSRRAHQSAECTLEEIWSEMPVSWRSVEDSSWDAYIEAELQCEADHLRAIPRCVDLLQEAAAHDVPTVLISDTYLSGTQLRRLLSSAGVPIELVADVITSSDRRLNKTDGLLAAVANERGVATDRVLHIGDHPGADVRAALAAGARALLMDVAEDHRITNAMPAALAAHSARSGTDGGADALSRMLLLDATGASSSGGDVDAAYQFGASVGGPLLAGFADWLTSRTREFGTTKVHYLLREGAFLADVVDTARPDAPESVLVHASRWVNMRASVFDGSTDEVFRALARRVAFRPEHVTEAFDVDPALVEATIGNHVRDDAGRLEAIEAIVASDEIRGAILESSATLRRRVMRYLEQRLQPEHGRLVLCDIGWGGTIQESITDLLLHEGWDVEVVGLYLLLSAPGLDRVARGARMLGFLPADGPAADAAAIVMRTPEIPEQLCTDDLGTLHDIDADGQPITAPVPTAAAESRQRARRGVIDFVSLRRTMFPESSGDARLSNPAYASAVLDGLAGTIGAPDPSLARELGTWEHDDVRGVGHEPLVNSTAADTVRFLNAADLEQIDMRELYWVPGAAAVHNPTLAAQLDAVRLGADAELLCPPSEIGPALIALFAPGSAEAVAQLATTPHHNAAGWMMLRLAATVDALRAVRFDLGDRDSIVELGHLSIHRTAPQSERTDEVLRITDTDDARLHWTDGYPTGPRHGVVAAGGHLIVEWPPDCPVPIGSVTVELAYRGWRLTGDEVERFTPTMRHRLRLAGSIPRRLARRARGASRAVSRATASSDEAPAGGPASVAQPDS